MQTTLLITSAVLILYWLSGYLPGRAIGLKRNRWQAWGFFGQIWGFIDGDKKSILPKSMPFGMGKVFWQISYTKWVENGRLEEYTETSTEGKKITYHKAQIIPGIKKPIRTVTEEITRLRKKEVHPYVIKVTLPKTGGTFYLVFEIATRIKDPNRTLKMDEFLLFIGNQLNDRVFPWAVAWEASVEARHTGISKVELTDMIIDEILGLNIDNDDSIMFEFQGSQINLKTYMNQVIDEFGGEIADFSLDVGYDEKIEEILNLRHEQKLELERQRDQDNKNATRAKERQKELDDANQERTLDQKYLTEVAIPALEAEAKAQAAANAGWTVGTLMMGDAQKQPALLIKERPNSKKQGGANAANTTV